MSAPLFQANRMPECRVIFSHSTVVFCAGSTESTRTEDNVLKNRSGTGTRRHGIPCTVTRRHNPILTSIKNYSGNQVCCRCDWPLQRVSFFLNKNEKLL
jgi:hypothetical protein